MSLPLWRTKVWEGVDEAMAEARSDGLPVKSFEQCGIDKNTAVGVIEVAVAEPFRVLAEMPNWPCIACAGKEVAARRRNEAIRPLPSQHEVQSR